MDFAFNQESSSSHDTLSTLDAMNRSLIISDTSKTIAQHLDYYNWANLSRDAKQELRFVKEKVSSVPSGQSIGLLAYNNLVNAAEKPQ
jgi:hypothetical protein